MVDSKNEHRPQGWNIRPYPHASLCTRPPIWMSLAAIAGWLLARAPAKRQRACYIAITDHTKGLKIANGLDERQLVQQRYEIDATNQKLGDSGANFRILRSAEVNLSPGGEPDISPDALSKLDLVLGFFHSALRRTEDQTKRYLAALRNKSVHILGSSRDSGARRISACCCLQQPLSRPC
jgi:hypothetical protein